jgi:hypothetical protein
MKRNSLLFGAMRYEAAWTITLGEGPRIRLPADHFLAAAVGRRSRPGGVGFAAVT